MNNVLIFSKEHINYWMRTFSFDPAMVQVFEGIWWRLDYWDYELNLIIYLTWVVLVKICKMRLWYSIVIISHGHDQLVIGLLDYNHPRRNGDCRSQLMIQKFRWSTQLCHRCPSQLSQSPFSLWRQAGCLVPWVADLVLGFPSLWYLIFSTEYLSSLHLSHHLIIFSSLNLRSSAVTFVLTDKSDCNLQKVVLLCKLFSILFTSTINLLIMCFLHSSCLSPSSLKLAAV